MPKKESPTLQQRLGFGDDDLKKPKHDDIMFWLDANIESILNQYFPLAPISAMQLVDFKTTATKNLKTTIEHRQDKIDQLEKEILSNSNKEAANRTLIAAEGRKIDYMRKWDSFKEIPVPVYQDYKKQWEYPISTEPRFNSSKYVVGFVDFVLKVNRPVDYYLSGFKIDQPASWKPVYDIVSEPKIVPITGEQFFLFEVKTEIKSVGELIRQINYYKEYAGGYYVVISPEEKFADILKEQGIMFIPYLPK